MTYAKQLESFDALAEAKWSGYLDGFIERLREIAEPVKSSRPYWMPLKQQWRCEKHAGKTGEPVHGSNFDCQEFCEKCGMMLDHFFTDWGKRTELCASAESDTSIGPEEALNILNVIDADLPRFTERWKDFAHGDAGDRALVRKIVKRLRITPRKVLKSPCASASRKTATRGTRSTSRTTHR